MKMMEDSLSVERTANGCGVSEGEKRFFQGERERLCPDDGWGRHSTQVPVE